MAIINGNDLPNTLIGTNESDVIQGFGGNDLLIGLGGNDNLIGGTGIDTMVGGVGNDYYYVDDAGDTISELGNDPGDFVIANISFDMNAYPGIPTGVPNIENLTLYEEASINGYGNSLNNRIVGNSGNNELYGREGNDTIEGRLGDDTLDGGVGIDSLVGGLGNDLYVVDAIGDIVTESANEGIDTVNTSVSYTLTANVENLRLTGTDNVNGTGNDLDNLLIGNAGVNTLSGGKGNDTLIGGAARDILEGGEGADRFVFGSPIDRVDRVMDFSRQEKDKLVFVSNGLDSFDGLRVGRVKKGQFVVGKRAGDRNDRFIYNEKRGILFYDEDGRGGAGQVRIATFADQPTLGAKDLLVVASPF